jgi:SAM-dependent methyltransferase
VQLARYRGATGGDLLIVDAGDNGLATEASSLGFGVTSVRVGPDGQSAIRVGSAARTDSPMLEMRVRGADPTNAAPGRTAAFRCIPGDSSSLRLPLSAPTDETACAGLVDAGLAPRSFDVCALTGALEAARDPLALLRAVRRLLKPRGELLVVTPSLDALCNRLTPGSDLMGSGPGRLTYFDSNTIQTALHQAGFDQVIVQSSRAPDARLNAGGVVARAAGGLRRALVQALSGDVPHPGGVLAMARAAEVPVCRTLSVVVPAYNEAATVGPLLEALLGKQVAGMRIEVIVVESNSTDGTRDIVRKYAAHPRLRLVLEDRPRGKGHAVRAGLAHASGDYVLIQDADLEYDLEDYDVLLEPLVAGREALVLGSRHGGNAWWKMRRFAGQPVASFALNFGHWFFTTLLNVLFGQRLKDPFTMYKVFRRDCLFGLDFKCNRFDFDYELLVKMIRKGYQPIEIPVNYRSRSFKQGKKVSAFRDPFNWLKALAWLRFVEIDPLAEVERRRAAEQGEARIARPVLTPSRAAA